MDITKYLHTLSTQSLAKGSFLFKENDTSDGTMYFVITGQVDMIVGKSDEARVINLIKAGGFFGEIALIKNLPRTATAIVSSPEAQIARLDKNVFLQVSRSNPEFLFDLLKTVLDRLIIAEYKIKKLSGEV